MNRKFPLSGGALVMVLLIVLVSGAMIAGWLSLISTQTLYIDAQDEASRRRIALENATALARQYVLTQVLPLPPDTIAPGTGGAVDLPDGAGTIDIPQYPPPDVQPVEPLSTFSKADGWNRFNPGNGDGYSAKVSPVTIHLTAALSEGMQARVAAGAVSPPDVSHVFDFLAKSRCPVLSGDLLVVNRPTLDPGATASITGSLAVSGRALLWAPDSSNSYSQTMSIYAAPWQPQTALSGTLSGFPFVATTSGLGFDGRLDVIAGEVSPLVAKAETGAFVEINGEEVEGTGVECDGAGTVRIDLAEPALENVLITGNTSTLILEGQSENAGYLAAQNSLAILIIVNQAAGDLTTVRMTHANNRRVALAIRKTTGTPVAFDVSDAGGGLPWRTVLTLENTPSSWDTHGQSFELRGGIQTDRDVAIPSGAIDLTPEPEPFYLERLTARDGWVEAFEQE